MIKKNFALTSFSAAFLTLGFSPSSLATDEKIETVYVSATRSETLQMPVSTQITVIDSEKIRLSGATVVTEVLKRQAGIQITDQDGSNNRNVTVSMRGLSGTNNTLILVDGRKLNNAASSAPALNTVSLRSIDRIEIIQGSAGVLFGEQAVGGVINIITKKAMKGELEGTATITAGSFGLQDTVVNLRQGFDNGLSYSVSAQDRESDNFRDNNESKNQNYLANVRYEFSRGYVFAEAQKVNDNLRLPGALYDDQVITNPRATDKPSDFSDQDNNIARLGTGITMTDNISLVADYADRDESTLGFLGGAFKQNLHQKNLSPRVIVKLPMQGSELVSTIGYDQVNAHYDIHSAFGDTKASQHIKDIYAQFIVPVVSDLHLTAGARHSTVEDEARVIDYRGNQLKQKDQSSTAVELGANYAIQNGWEVFARIADGFRYANANDYSYALKGFDFLLPQESQTEEIGARWSSSTLNVQYALYNMDIDNEIIFDGLTYANINSTASERSGGNVNLSWNIDSWIDLALNYTYTDAKVSLGANKGKLVPYVAKHTANAAVNFHWVESVNVQVAANYVGTRYRSNDDENNQGKLPENIIWDLNATWSPISSVDVQLGVKNITNETYANFHTYNSWAKGSVKTAQYPQPERNYTLGVSYHF